MQEKQNEVQTSNSKKLSGFTITSIVMAAIGFWVNPLCILSVLGIVFGGIGIGKSNSSKDKTWAIIMLGMSIMETLFWFAITANAMAAL